MQRVFQQMENLPAWAGGGFQAPRQLGLVKGAAVHVWSNRKSRWFEDGIIQEDTKVDKVVGGALLPPGSVKVAFDGGEQVAWVLPQEAKEVLRKVPCAAPPAWDGDAKLDEQVKAMVGELREVEARCRALTQPFFDQEFRLTRGVGITAWLRPQQVRRHEGRSLCQTENQWIPDGWLPESWNVFCPSPTPPRPLPNVDWKVIRGAPRSDDIQQGALGDCWFLSSLAALAEFQGGRFIHALLPDQNELSPAGAYTVRLCLGGCWRGVLIDDRLPCVGGQMAYCVTKRLQLWASLVEKGFAKVCGTYECTGGGEAGEALEMLTGWPCTLLVHGRAGFDPDVLWATLCSSRDAEFLMICSTKNVRSSSLEPNHVYSLMDVYDITSPVKGDTRLLKIRNPNAKSKWNGDWSDGSYLWTPQLRQRLGCPEGGHPHVFFMALEDFLKEFAHCTICRIRSSEWHERREPLNLTHGAAPCTALVVDVSETTECTFSLVQPGGRLRGGPLFPHLQGPLACIGFVVLRLGYGREEATVAHAGMARRAIVSADCWLDPGRYVLVPVSMHAGTTVEATLACHTSRPVVLKEQKLEAEGVRDAWVAYTKASSGPPAQFHGAEMYISKSDGGCFVAYVENPGENNMHCRVEIAFKTESLGFSRGSATSADWLAPGQAQIVNIAQPIQSEDVRCSWAHTFGMSKTPAGQKHDPDVQPGDQLHTPFRMGGLSSESCVLQ